MRILRITILRITILRLHILCITVLSISVLSISVGSLLILSFRKALLRKNIVTGLFLPVFLRCSSLNRRFLNWRLFRLIVRSLTLSIALNGSVVFKLIHFIDHSFLEFILIFNRSIGKADR